MLYYNRFLKNFPKTRAITNSGGTNRSNQSSGGYVSITLFRGCTRLRSQQCFKYLYRYRYWHQIIYSIW